MEEVEEEPLPLPSSPLPLPLLQLAALVPVEAQFTPLYSGKGDRTHQFLLSSNHLLELILHVLLKGILLYRTLPSPLPLQLQQLQQDQSWQQ